MAYTAFEKLIPRNDPTQLTQLMVIKGLSQIKKAGHFASEVMGPGINDVLDAVERLGADYYIENKDGEIVTEITFHDTDTMTLSDSAMITAGKDQVGGINLDARKMDLRTRGDDVDFIIPAGFENMSPDAIPGFTPVIINIVPAVNLPVFLGVSKNASSSPKVS